MTSAVGNRSTHAITTPTTRRSIQDLCSRGFLIAQPVFFAHITSYQTHTHTHRSRTGLGPASELFRLSTPAKQPVYIFLYRFIANIHFLQFCFLFFFLLFNFIQITRKNLCGLVSQAKVFGLIWLLLFSYCCWDCCCYIWGCCCCWVKALSQLTALIRAM